MTPPVQIVPSVLPADFARLGTECMALAQAGVDKIQWDVMDGHFVPNLTFGPDVIAAARSHVDVPFEAHLMVQRPDDLMHLYVEACCQMLIIHAETTQIDVLYADGCPAGFFERDSSGLPETVELAYFGLCPDYVGLGLGKWFLANAIESAWDKTPERVTVHTNSLDHAAALPLYQRLGFEPVGTAEETVEVWD